MTFRYRLALFLIGTLVAVQALTAVFAYVYLRHSLVERGKRELMAEVGVFTRQLEFLSERVTDAVKVLSLDYPLRVAIAQHDHGTEVSALRNHGDRIGATRMMLLDLEGRVSADTASPSGADGKFSFPQLLETAGTLDKATGLVAFGGRIYWIVVVPVRAPTPIAFIAAFIPVNGALLERLRSISAEPRTIVLATRTASGWQIAARSLARLQHVDLPQSREAPTRETSEAVEHGQQYLAITAPLPTAKASAPVVAVLTYPLDDAFAAYRTVIFPLLFVLGAALLAAASGAMLIVRSLSRPLERLAIGARQIAAGDYNELPEIKQRDEIGHLAAALSNMARSIEEREKALRAAVEATEFAKDEAVKANEVKSQFLANMSHEFRTPLNAILGFSEIMEHQVLGPLGARQYVNYAHDIHASGERLLGLVERMLDLAEAETKQLELSRSPIYPLQLLNEGLAALRPFAEKCSVQLFGPGDFSCPEIEGDAIRLRQAFVNIVHNALRFTPPGGEVRVRGFAGDGRIVIEIADNGIGMPPEVLTRVVRPFHRQRSALDGQHQGAGLGLPFAKAIVEIHGGSLAVESRVGAGTTVVIELPADGAILKAA